MAGKRFLHVLILLKFIHCKELEPPQGLAITDLGQLGNLKISWSPQEHIWMKEQKDCSVWYELHHYSYSRGWESVQTSRTSFTALFDLAQEVKVCVYTLIPAACAGGTEVKSQKCSELVQKPNRAGVDGIQDLTCVSYVMEHLVCNWKRSSKMPSHSHVALYYWQRRLEQAKECPHYVLSDGLRIGCNFSGTSLPISSSINLVVNASAARPVRAVYSSVVIQDIVKLNPVAEVRVEASADRQLRVHWDSPKETIPLSCLQWEVEERRESNDGKQMQQQIFSSEKESVMLTLDDGESVCLSVRSMLNYLCSSAGLWSDWSAPVCYPEKKHLTSASGRDMLPAYVMYIPLICGSALVLALCVWAVITLRRMRRLGQVKTKDSSLNSLVDKSPA